MFFLGGNDGHNNSTTQQGDIHTDTQQGDNDTGTQQGDSSSIVASLRASGRRKRKSIRKSATTTNNNKLRPVPSFLKHRSSGQVSAYHLKLMIHLDYLLFYRKSFE